MKQLKGDGKIDEWNLSGHNNIPAPMKTFLEKLFPSLTAKVIIAVMCIFLSVGVSFLFYTHEVETAILEKQGQAKALSVAEFGKSFLEHLMLEGKSGKVKSAMRAMVSSRQASDILILRTDGTVWLSATGPSSSSSIPLANIQGLLESSGDKFITTEENDSFFTYIITPLHNAQLCQMCHGSADSLRGHLAVKVAIDDIRAIGLRHRTMNILSESLTFGGLGAVIFFALLVLVIRPIKKLQGHMLQIEGNIAKFEEDNDLQLPHFQMPARNDEIGDLTRAFNSLVNRLNGATAKIRELHRAQLEKADHLTTAGEMATSIAHEIKNPLTGILGALQVFNAEISHDDSRKKIFAEMIIQLERINQAVNDLLSYARPTAPVFEMLNLTDVMAKTLTLFSQQTKNNNVTINSNLAEDTILVLADRKLLQQVLWNILLNAIQAIDSSGIVNVSCKKNNINAVIEISDTGKGISAEHLPYIFKPFFTTKHRGTGLGMAISKRIIEQHHGAISVASEVGKGTHVIITIPLTTT